VTDVPSKLEEFRRVLRTLDIAQRQVLIEARIVEAEDTFGRSLGVRLRGNSGTPREVFGSGAYGSVTGPNSTLGSGASGTNNGQTTFTSTNFSIGGNDFLNLPAAGLSGFNAAGFAVTLFNSSLTRVVGLEITALEADGRGRIISSPRVITADQVRATIEDGEEIPYEQATSSGATSIAFRKAVLKLDVTPQITPEGNVILTVNVNKDSRGVETRAGPAINTKNVNTQVLIDNGGTVVIGGIYTQTERSDNVKVPLLGDIPYVGNLFKNNRRTNDRRELLVFLTPRIISDAVANSAVKSNSK
jgi:type IV pilus assembly protein PilQ